MAIRMVSGSDTRHQQAQAAGAGAASLRAGHEANSDHPRMPSHEQVSEVFFSSLDVPLSTFTTRGAARLARTRADLCPASRASLLRLSIHPQMPGHQPMPLHAVQLGQRGEQVDRIRNDERLFHPSLESAALNEFGGFHAQAFMLKIQRMHSSAATDSVELTVLRSGELGKSFSPQLVELAVTGLTSSAETIARGHGDEPGRCLH